METQIEKTIDGLRKNNIQGYHAADREELLRLLDGLIPEHSTVGCGDSVTLEQLGVFDHLRASDIDFYDKHKDGLTSAEKREIYLDNFRADIFISGTNALTENGEIINIDGNGSRVAPMLYGPKKVIIDCKSKDRICNDFVMISRQFDPGRIHVIIIDGSYGY